MDKAVMQAGFMGSYKLSLKVLLKMVSASSNYKGRYAGASRYEILALIHLSHIADVHGNVENFRASEFIPAIGCSRREAFSLMHSLADKGYISITSSDWKCCFNIRINDNDFSDFHGQKYLNTNHEFFEKGRELHNDLLNLSHTSLRLLLYLLYNYSPKYGYNASYDLIMTSLGIKNKRVIDRCLDELNGILWSGRDFYSVRPDLKRGLYKGYVSLRPGQSFFKFTAGLTRGQESYFKRRVSNIITDVGARVFTLKEDSLISRAFGILIRKDLSPDTAFDLIRNTLADSGVFNELTLRTLALA